MLLRTAQLRFPPPGRCNMQSWICCIGKSMPIPSTGPGLSPSATPIEALICQQVRSCFEPSICGPHNKESKTPAFCLVAITFVIYCEFENHITLSHSSQSSKGTSMRCPLGMESARESHVEAKQPAE